MKSDVEWPTLAMLFVTYLIWALATTVVASSSLWVAVPLAAISIAQFSSLQHEAIHGHPFRDARLNALLVFPALLLVIPYARFRDQHLAHHRDSELTDPFDDPESNYLAPETWERLPRSIKMILNANNTLIGRLTLGPAIGTAIFLGTEVRDMGRDPRIVAGWAWHALALVPVALWLGWVSAMPVWLYLVACYGAMSLLRIRTFLEHQAHDRARCRTVIIDERGPLAVLFLMNNFHVVHHMHPRVPWYRLPTLYRANRDRYLRQNDGYHYRSYGEIFRLYLFRRKDPVPHPLRTHG